MSKRFCPSYSLTSKLTFPVQPKPLNRQARHSILKMRPGAVPDVEVNTPQPSHVSKTQPPVHSSSQWANIAWFIAEVGTQALPPPLLLPVNCRLPFELAITPVKGCPYRLYVKGSGILAVQL